jgi:hypothetical protein
VPYRLGVPLATWAASAATTTAAGAAAAADAAAVAAVVDPSIKMAAILSLCWC